MEYLRSFHLEQEEEVRIVGMQAQRPTVRVKQGGEEGLASRQADRLACGQEVRNAGTQGGRGLRRACMRF